MKRISLKNQDGQSVTEFALVLPILAFLLFAVIQFGIVFNNWVQLTDATRAGARKGAVSRHLPSPQTVCASAVRASATNLKASDLTATLHLDLAAGSGCHGQCHVPLFDQPVRDHLQVGPPLEHNHGACGMRIKIKSKRGQAMILTLVFMTVILGMAAAVVDVGAWYRTHRQMQNNADAAALAGATALPESTGQAASLAVTYANRNGGGVTGPDVTFSSKEVANDQIQVTARKQVPGVFAKLFGLDSVNVRAHATALAAPPAQPKWAAPFAVDVMHPMLQCEPLPCFNQATTLDLDKVGPGAFHIVNIDSSHGGTSPGTLAQWVETGLDAYMPLGWYYSDPGSKFNSGQVRGALDDRIGSDLLFPVYRHLRAQGAGFEYEVIGWVGFHLTGYSIGGKGKLFGSFTRIIWDGIQTESSTPDDFGVRSISLVD